MQKSSHKKLSMLAKLTWRFFVNPSSMLATVLLSKYSNKICFSKEKNHSETNSSIWKNALLGWEICKE